MVSSVVYVFCFRVWLRFYTECGFKVSSSLRESLLGGARARSVVLCSVCVCVGQEKYIGKVIIRVRSRGVPCSSLRCPRHAFRLETSSGSRGDDFKNASAEATGTSIPSLCPRVKSSNRSVPFQPELTSKSNSNSIDLY